MMNKKQATRIFEPDISNEFFEGEKYEAAVAAALKKAIACRREMERKHGVGKREVSRPDSFGCRGTSLVQVENDDLHVEYSKGMRSFYSQFYNFLMMI